MKVLGLITSPIDPASRARILQYIAPLEKNNIIVTPRYFKPTSYANPEKWAYQLNKITRINEWRLLDIQRKIKRMPLLWEQFKYDLIWQNRLILQKHSFFEKNISKPKIFDIDDAIWVYDGKKKVSDAIKRAHRIFAGNEYLANFANKYNKNITIIPSVINTEKLYPIKKQSNPFTIGWIGSTFNFAFLNIIKPAVISFLSKYKESRFIIISSEPPKCFNFDNQRIIFKRWSDKEENEHIAEFSIGLMPIKENEFTRGKCSYKMLQYMACGIPPVVSPVGMNNKILSQKTIGLAANSTEEWISAFERFKHDEYFYHTCAVNCRILIENNYALNKLVPIVSELLKSTLISK